MTTELVAIDERRLLRRLDELAQRGAGAVGVTRLPYTPAWVAATELVSSWLREAGLLVRRDAVGNVWGRIEGARGGRAIVTGSHLDTVKAGGALDGALGVVAGIEAVASLVARRGRPTRILECVAIAEEEGSRFNTGFFGARAIADRLEPEETARARDPEGVTLADAMRGVGLDPDRAPQAARRDIDTFVELHVEQGSLLDQAAEPVAIVRAIAGSALLEVVVRGEADAAGIPLDGRRDALLGAAAMTLEVAAVARAAGPPAVATVGTITVEPGLANTVPGLVRFTVDARHEREPERRALLAEIEKACRVIGHERDLAVEVRTLRDRAPAALAERGAEVLRRSCRAAGIDAREMTSAAPHAAQILAASAHTAMLFVPSVGGRSHRADEATAAEDVVLGTRILATALCELAY